MPMRILINSINYSPELTGIGKYTGEMAEWLAEQGYDVRVVTAPPYYPAWRVAEGYSAGWYGREIVAGVTVFRCPLWVPKKPTGVTRILHLASFALSSFPLMLWSGLFWRPNIVFVIEPPLFCAPAAWMSARVGGARAWLHVQDFEVDAAFELGILRARALRSVVLAVEKWLLRRFDTVSSISLRMVERLANKGVESSRRMLFPNWVDTSAIYPLESVEGFRRELGVPEGVKILLYSGNMGEKQGLEILIETANMLSERQDILFILCGEGASRQRLMEMSEGLGNIKFIPLQPIDRLNELLNVADIHLLPQRADAEDLVMPSKLTAILASGRPVIATVRDGSQIANVVRDCGIVVSPGDAAGVRDAIAALAGDSGRRLSLGKAGRDFAVRNWKKDNVLRHAFHVNCM